ncbi:FGGY-family carbohydrate kinase [Tateyamaria sp. SN6-1]|uniref:FGGY-family carbohydrate kinase n=1 Tax=Tateyamaria sp. SN6-1 TaxID=3092148 RepID=UPI0039F59665
MTHRHIAVIDIGKTNAKLVLVDAADLSEIEVITRPNTVLPGPPWPHFDVEAHWQFLLHGLRRFQHSHGIDAISITTHGACAALLDAEGMLAAPILDYEHAGPDDLAREYDTLRPAFAETGSPRLTGGLNVGAQLHWQFAQDPTLHARTHRIVTYPQFWGARLTGVAATDVTSLGCHTDLWDPAKAAFSTLVDSLDIRDKMAPRHVPSDILGPILPEIAGLTRIPESTPVHCGIHDSNASLLPYLHSLQTPFSVVSTGTWIITMSIGGTTPALDPARDTLINVTADGTPAPSARFMGGREHDIATGGAHVIPSAADIDAVFADQVMLMPAVVPDTGPFKGRTAHWVGDEPPMGSGQRTAAVAFYLGLVTAECLTSIGHEGVIVVEGPLAANTLFLDMLSVAMSADVYRSASVTGTSAGAARLALDTDPPPAQLDLVKPDSVSRLQAYAAQWRAAVRT